MQTSYHDVVISFFDGETETYNYVYQNGSNDHYSIRSLENPLETCGVAVVHDLWKIITSVLSVVFTLIFFIAPFTDDDDNAWEFGLCWRLAKVSTITSYFADKIYYYQYNGRLLLRSEWQADRSDLIDKLYQYERTPETFPVYDGPTAIRRNTKLDILLGKIKS